MGVRATSAPQTPLGSTPMAFPPGPSAPASPRSPRCRQQSKTRAAACEARDQELSAAPESHLRTMYTIDKQHTLDTPAHDPCWALGSRSVLYSNQPHCTPPPPKPWAASSPAPAALAPPSPHGSITAERACGTHLAASAGRGRGEVLGTFVHFTRAWRPQQEGPATSEEVAAALTARPGGVTRPRFPGEMSSLDPAHPEQRGDTTSHGAGREVV